MSLGGLLWWGARNLDGHVQAGADVVLEALARTLPNTTVGPLTRLNDAERLLPGLGDVYPLRIDPHNWAAGRTLGEIDLHGWCGAIPVVLWRGKEGVPNPGPGERLESDDVLVVVGNAEATQAARELLSKGQPQAISL